MLEYQTPRAHTHRPHAMQPRLGALEPLDDARELSEVDETIGTS